MEQLSSSSSSTRIGTSLHELFWFLLQVEIVEAKQELYAAFVDGNLAVKIGSGEWQPGAVRQQAWSLAASDTSFAVWAS